MQDARRESEKVATSDVRLKELEIKWQIIEEIYPGGSCL